MSSVKSARRRTTPKPASQPSDLVSFDDIPQGRSCSEAFSVFDLSARQYVRMQNVIERVVNDHFVGPNKSNRRAKLDSSDLEQFKIDLMVAVGFAASLSIRGPLKNRKCGRGRPPDNIAFILIDDIARACGVAGIKPGLRFVEPKKGFAVDLYISLAP
ncbi:MAG: hypothetical protein ACTHN2_08365, partial [Nitrobacter sp.]